MALRLSEIGIDEIDRLQHVALMRLTLRTMGDTHERLGEFSGWLSGWVQRRADGNGDAGPRMGTGIGEIDERYRSMMTDWRVLFAGAQRQAATLPMGAWLVKHNFYMTQAQRPIQEELSAGELGVMIRLWQQRRERAIEAASRRTYGDGLILSDRLWRMENDGLARIRGTLAMAMSERTNAVDLAKKLEGALGVDADMPRWTRDRLYGMSAKERAASGGGLLRGSENRSRGVAYNALRLARTELQYANHAVTTEIAKRSPWVTGRHVRLSPAHPQIDICDEYASGGPYPVGDELLPLHPNCLCFYEEDLMPPDVFTSQVSGWLNGRNDFLDEYAAWLGMQQPTELVIWGLSEADSLEMWLGQSGDAHAALLRLSGSPPPGSDTPIVVPPVRRPPVVGPSGPVVSQALLVPRGGKYGSRYQAALDAIDSVHGDGQLPEIPVRTKSNIKALGQYVSYANGKPVGIDMNGKGDQFELTLAHEVGHFLDQQAIGQTKIFASRSEPLLAGWRRVVQESQAVRTLRDMQENPSAYERVVLGGERTYTVRPDGRYLNYLLSNEEIWARSYSQYIAERSGNTTMRQQVEIERGDTLYGQKLWSDEDFAPIAAEFDRVFGGLGWRK